MPNSRFRRRGFKLPSFRLGIHRQFSDTCLPPPSFLAIPSYLLLRRPSGDCSGSGFDRGRPEGLVGRSCRGLLSFSPRQRHFFVGPCRPECPLLLFVDDDHHGDGRSEPQPNQRAAVHKSPEERARKRHGGGIVGLALGEHSPLGHAQHLLAEVFAELLLGQRLQSRAEGPQFVEQLPRGGTGGQRRSVSACSSAVNSPSR